MNSDDALSKAWSWQAIFTGKAQNLAISAETPVDNFTVIVSKAFRDSLACSDSAYTNLCSIISFRLGLRFTRAFFRFARLSLISMLVGHG